VRGLPRRPGGRQPGRDHPFRPARARPAHSVPQREVTLRLKRITEQVAPALTALRGVGPDVATTLLLAAGDNPERLANERSFASLCGVSPVQASSGKTRRHRLNRGGDGQANAALWRITLVRLHCDPRTKDYLAS